MANRGCTNPRATTAATVKAAPARRMSFGHGLASAMPSTPPASTRKSADTVSVALSPMYLMSTNPPTSDPTIPPSVFTA